MPLGSNEALEAFPPTTSAASSLRSRRPFRRSRASATKAKSRQGKFTRYGLYSLPANYRLALEMALHEESERRVLEGELGELERAWQDAEQIAGIADHLLVPDSVDAQFEHMKTADKRLKGES